MMQATATMQCESCHARVKTLDGGKADSGIVCPECGKVFCDNCYDTGLGDGCKCHRRRYKVRVYGERRQRIMAAGSVQEVRRHFHNAGLIIRHVKEA